MSAIHSGSQRAEVLSPGQRPFGTKADIPGPVEVVVQHNGQQLQEPMRKGLVRPDVDGQRLVETRVDLDHPQLADARKRNTRRPKEAHRVPKDVEAVVALDVSAKTVEDGMPRQFRLLLLELLAHLLLALALAVVLALLRHVGESCQGQWITNGFWPESESGGKMMAGGQDDGLKDGNTVGGSDGSTGQRQKKR